MTPDNTHGFRKAVTIFIDILGSQDRENFDEWYSIMKIFADIITSEKLYDQAHPHTVYKREIHVFSDCAYIIYDYKPDIDDSRKNDVALMNIACYNTEKVLAEFLRNGFLIRGSLTFDDIYYDPDHNIWFGPAMNRAYYLESKVAKYPRVIIDPQFADKLVEYNNENYKRCPLNALNGSILKKDEDDLYYIHYLNSYQLGFNRIENSGLENRVMNLCQAELSKKRETPELQRSINEKYEWLEKYIWDSRPPRSIWQ